MATSMLDVTGNKIVNCEPYMNYDPLPEGYVRLLKIQENPNTWNIEEEIEISLTSVPLAECPPYIALSYAWVESEPFVDATTIIFTKVPRCFPIKCQGRLILGTRNLRNALRRLRQLEELQKSAPAHSTIGKMAADIARNTKNIRLYWVDALCIDQEDLHERSTQVLLMGKIFRQAQCTIAWLGEQNTYTSPAMQVLLKIVNVKIAQDSFILVADSKTTKQKFSGTDDLDDTEITALAMLMVREWISRLWILQEVIVAPSVLTMWGGVMFSFEMLARAGSILSMSRSSIKFIDRVLRIFARGHLATTPENVKVRIARAQSTLTFIDSIRRKLQQNLKPSFIDTVSMCQFSVSTDPRDKIYGILGLAAEFELGGRITYKPDYSCAVAEVYVSATAFVIKSRGDLACLTLVCDSSHKNIKELPSWCPDYSTVVPPQIYFPGVSKIWQLGQSWLDAQIPEILGTSILRVDGSMFDIIAETSSLLKGGQSAPKNHGVSAVFNLAIQLRDRGSSIYRTSQPHGPFETLWRTLTIDQFGNKAPAPATAAFLIPAFVAFLFSMISNFRQEEPDKLESGSCTRTLKAKESALKELQRLESIVDQLEGLEHQASPGLPNVDRIRKWIENSSYQNIAYGFGLAVAEELQLFCQAHNPADLEIDMSGLDRSISGSNVDQARQLLERYFINPLGDGRLSRIYFRTSGNTLGTGHASIRPGDETWFLHGASAPVVLRPLADGNYRFVGEVYVHGVMYGEGGAESRAHKPIMII